jgi:hypothetical protein
MPIEPVDPSKRTGGDGNEKYTPDEKRGPGKFDEALDKAKVDRAKADVSKMAEETRAKAEAERPRTYTERLQDMGRLPKPTGGGGGGMGGNKLSNRDLTRAYKTGGKVSSASKRADGCAVKGKTKGTIIACGGYMKGKK